MDIRQVFLIISNLLALASPFFYSYDILKGRAKPHRTTRLVFLVITALAFSSLLAQHNQVAVWLAGIALFQSSLVFILSLKYGVGAWEKRDLLCLLIAGIGIIIWKLTDNPLLGLYSAIVADFTGFVPTLIKTYRRPSTESLAFFLINLFACIFNILAVSEVSIQNLSYPAYLVLMNFTIVLLILRPKIATLRSA